jgi:endonuclease/exonuclease/phosphatase (EEP) superfamily protein YafD
MKAFLKIRFWGLFSAASFLACVATVLGFLGQWSWLCELFSHFRVHYLVGLLVLSLLLLIGKHKKEAFLCFVFALINLCCVLPLLLSKEQISPLDYPFGHHRCMLININSELGNPGLVMDAVRQEQPEFLVLEEVTESWMHALSGLTNPLPYCVASPREDNFGIALFSKYPLIGKNILYLGEAEVPSILASVKIDGRILEILATHPLPPISSEYASLRNEQLDRVADCIKGRSPLLLLGDLNMTPWSPCFQRFITQTGLHDSARGFGFQPSWPTHLPFLGIPIDHCLHSEEIGIMNRKIGSRVGSDHFPLIIDFALRSSPIRKM